MKYILLLLIFPFLSSGECGKKKKTAAEQKEMNGVILACISKLVEEANKETPPRPPEQIDEYLYNEKTVYLFTAKCCDFYNMLYDSACNVLCAPSGGITGAGDGICKDFSKTAKYIKPIWKDTAR